MQRYHVCALVAGSFVGLASVANAHTISNIQVVNNSSPDTVQGGVFATQSTVSAVADAASTSSFTHRMAFYNGFEASGGVAQVHREIVNFDLQFTVEDPTNVGYNVSVESIMRGISSITQTTNLGTAAVATGIDFFVETATLPPGTFATLIGLFHSTPGVAVIGVGSETELQQNIVSTSLGDYVGTNTFVLRLNSLFSPTTNVFFQNGEAGSGYINYGLGTVPSTIDVNAADLGNFLNVKATFVPEPSTLMLVAISGALSVARRGRRARR